MSTNKIDKHSEHQRLEYFHGDNVAGLGASHQTGWTGTVARIIQLLGSTTAEQALEGGRLAALTTYKEV